MVKIGNAFLVVIAAGCTIGTAVETGMVCRADTAAAVGPSASVAPLQVHPAEPSATVNVAPGQSPTSPDGDDTVTIEESGAAQYIDKDHRCRMSGGVTFHQKDTVVTTEAALVDLDKDWNALDAQSLAPVHMYDSQDDLTCDEGHIDFTHHLATLTNHITLIVKPSKKDSVPEGHNGPDSRSASSQDSGKQGGTRDTPRSKLKEPATMTCDSMTYDYRKKLGHIPGKLTVHQKDRVLTADSGDYDGYKKTVTLVGDVHGTDSKGNVINAPKVVIGVDEDNEWIFISGPFNMVVNTRKSTDNEGGDEDSDANHEGPAPPPELPLPSDNPITPSPSPAPSSSTMPAKS